MLKETFETTQKTREINILNRKEEDEIIDYIKKYYRGEQTRALITIYGDAGSGKSFLVKNVIDRIGFDKEKFFYAYLDVSDCVDQAEVYYRIAIQLRDYYFGNKEDTDKDKTEKAELIVKLYEWTQGIYRKDAADKTEKATSLLDVAEFVTKKLENIIPNISDDEEGIEMILSYMADTVPWVSNAIRGLDLVRSVKENTKQKKWKKLLKSNLDMLNNRTKRQDYLLGMLKKALPKEAKQVIILDNFQLTNNELGKDYTWLTGNNKLMREVNAFWIVVSRRSSLNLFQTLFTDTSAREIRIKGFDEDTARKYLNKNCFPSELLDNYEYLKEEKDDLMDEMLKAARLRRNLEDATGYLPYLLRMIVLYYWKMIDTPGMQVTPDLFIERNSEDEFVGYYFYKDMSDLMINAFQILSCIDVWDGEWIKLLQQKMDNHLLNAYHLLEHTAPIERIEPEGFKLHEALREALYRNKQNYIKQDVMEYLFECFIIIYEEKNEKNIIWYDLKRIQSFMEIVFSYIDFQGGNSKEKLEKIRTAVQNIYNKNKDRGTVCGAFIRLYSFYIDKIKDVYGISFVNTVGNDFESAELEEIQNVNCDMAKETLYYMECCLKLADLYTNNSQNGIARRLEKLCIQFWDQQLDAIHAEKSVWYYQCWQQKIKAINSTAFDSSAEHEYNAAYQLALEGDRQMKNLCKALITDIFTEENSNKFIETYNPESRLLLSEKGDNEEIPYELYEKLMEEYKEIWRMKDAKNEKEQILWKVIMEDCQNLRGNYPWYVLHNRKLNKEIVENEESLISYGIHTYWMRRTMLEALGQVDINDKEKYEDTYKRKMITSYQNICVYLGEYNKLEKACLLGVEVLEESRLLLKKQKPNDNAMFFLEQMGTEEKVDELQYFLWKQNQLDENSGYAFFSQHENIIEQMEYLGDFYLRMERYKSALKWLTRVMLFRTVSLGETDNKTLDTVLRYYIVSYAKQKEEPQLYKLMDQYVRTHYIDEEEKLGAVQQINESKGKQDKYNQLKEIVEIGENAENINKAVHSMAHKLK